MPLDLSDDMDLFDAVETVTYQRPNLSGGGVTEYTGVVALLHWGDSSLAAVGPGQMMVSPATYHVKVNSLAVSPRRGDKIVSTTHGTFEVLVANLETLYTRHVLTCRKVA